MRQFNCHRYFALALASFLGLTALTGVCFSQPATLVERGGLNRCKFSSEHRVEPKAGTWRTWILESPRQIAINAPPYAPEEIAELRRLELARDAAVIDEVLYWDAGGPSYRWNLIALDEITRANLNNNRIARTMALLNVAIY